MTPDISYVKYIIRVRGDGNTLSYAKALPSGIPKSPRVEFYDSIEAASGFSTIEEVTTFIGDCVDNTKYLEPYDFIDIIERKTQYEVVKTIKRPVLAIEKELERLNKRKEALEKVLSTLVKHKP